MAHFVAHELHMRPSEILDNWCVPELLVAYGEYVNQIAQRNYSDWERTYIKNNQGTPAPPAQYVVRFISPEEIRDMTDE